jgi:hypothetical protein
VTVAVAEILVGAVRIGVASRTDVVAWRQCSSMRSSATRSKAPARAAVTPAGLASAAKSLTAIRRPTRVDDLRGGPRSCHC